MRVVKWGNSLAIRLPVKIVRQLGLKEGDSINVHANGNGLTVARPQRPEEVLASLRRFRGHLPAAQRLSRNEAHER